MKNKDITLFDFVKVMIAVALIATFIMLFGCVSGNAIYKSDVRRGAVRQPGASR